MISGHDDAATEVVSVNSAYSEVVTVTTGASAWHALLRATL